MHGAQPQVACEFREGLRELGCCGQLVVRNFFYPRLFLRWVGDMGDLSSGSERVGGVCHCSWEPSQLIIGVSEAMVGASAAAAAGLGVPLGRVCVTVSFRLQIWKRFKWWCSGPVECKSGERKGEKSTRAPTRVLLQILWLSGSED